MIASLGLEPLPEEGGWFRQTWRSPLDVGGRPAGTAIIALFTAREFSAMHRLGGVEVWHFDRGDPFRLVLLHPGGGDEEVVLGPDGAVQTVVEAGTWMGGAPIGEWSLVGATMAPGFVPEDFELGDRATLSARWPVRGPDIERLTRARS